MIYFIRYLFILKLRKPLAYILFLSCLTSCAYRTLEGRVKPVYFSADKVVFTDTLYPAQAVTYQNMKRLGFPCGERLDLHQGEEVKAFIAEPTIFQKENNIFLVYPGEHIFITSNAAKNYQPTFSTVRKSKVRDRELLVLQKFEEQEKRLMMPLLSEYNYQTIENTAVILQDKVIPTEQNSQILFDSLCNVYKVSRKFKKLTRYFVKNRYDLAVLELFKVYRDTISIHHAYERKVRALLSNVNSLNKTFEFSLNIERNTNSLYTALFPGIRNMVSRRGGFQATFDSITTYFTGPARDYLLSRLMYRTLEGGYIIPTGYYQQYRQYSMNKEYRRIIARFIKQTKRSQHNTPVLPNELLLSDGQTKTRMETVLADYKGKFVLVDLWASWCGPCLKEMPALQALRNKYSADKISFLSISVDASVTAWLSRLVELHGDRSSAFLLLNKNSSALTREIKLSTIPRYLLYNREGTLIDSDAPTPSDPELESLLDKILFE